MAPRFDGLVGVGGPLEREAVDGSSLRAPCSIGRR